MRRDSRPPSRPSPPHLLIGLITALLMSASGSAHAQVLERLGRAAKAEAEAETDRQVRDAVRTAIRCAIGDQACQEKARREGREVVLVDERGNPVDEEGASEIPPEGTHWNLTFDGEVSEGTIGYVNQVEGQIALHLVDRQAVNLHLIVSEVPGAPWEGVVADLVFGRGRQCAYPFDGAGPFSVEIVTEDPEWVSGSYDGVVRCEDGTGPVLLGGDFRVRRAP